MIESRKLLLDKFQEHIDTNYQQYCEKCHIEDSTESLLTFLIDQNLISNLSIKRYTIIHESEELIQKTQQRKTQTVNVLSDMFNIPERTIWDILKKRER